MEFWLTEEELSSVCTQADADLTAAPSYSRSSGIAHHSKQSGVSQATKGTIKPSKPARLSFPFTWAFQTRNMLGEYADACTNSKDRAFAHEATDQRA